MAKAEAAGRLVGHQDALVDRLPQRLAHVALGGRLQQRIADLPSGGRGDAEQVLRGPVEPGHAPQQQIAQAARELARCSPAASSSSAKNGLPSERAMISSVTAAGWRLAGTRLQQRRQLAALERAQLEDEP